MRMPLSSRLRCRKEEVLSEYLAWGCEVIHERTMSEVLGLPELLAGVHLRSASVRLARVLLASWIVREPSSQNGARPLNYRCAKQMLPLIKFFTVCSKTVRIVC